MFRRVLFLIVLFAFFSSCVTHKYAQVNHARFYEENYPGNILKTSVFNTNDSISEFFVQVDLKALSALSGKSISEILQSYVFDFSLLEGLKEKEILQSGRMSLKDSPDQSEFFKSFKIKLRTLNSGPYVLFSSIESNMPSEAYTSKVIFNKGSQSLNENFMLLNENGSIHWDNFVRQNEKVQIKVNDPSIKELYISWYAPKFSPAIVPFAPVKTNELAKLESTKPFKIELFDGLSDPLAFKDLGIYIVHTKEKEIKGFSIYKFFNEFPYVATDAQQLFTLRYLNPRWEFEELMAMEPEKAVEEFWFSRSRKKERSEDMMRTYYSRVQRANELFTSYKEGWKTDRGMIFMIYGAPDKVFKYKDKEVWEYGYDAYYNGLRFQFYRVNNPFTQNDFRLYRQAHYEPSWQGIVENWRTDI